jgi:hypothetical protein
MDVILYTFNYTSTVTEIVMFARVTDGTAIQKLASPRNGVNYPFKAEW